jgi:site-specific DNA-methyltransferase (adenine-specific)
MNGGLLNSIINIDCLDGFKLLDDNSIDLIITSPPYNLKIKYDNYYDDKEWENYKNFINKLAIQMYRVLKNDGRVCIDIPCEVKLI